MKKKILISISVCLLAAALLSTTASATLEASEFIWATNVSIAKTGRVVEVDCDVTATGIYPDVGIDWIEFYTADGDFLVRHSHDDPGYSYLMGSGTGSHAAVVTYTGRAGQSYYAKVCFYAGDMYGSGGDVHTMYSAIV